MSRGLPNLFRESMLRSTGVIAVITVWLGVMSAGCSTPEIRTAADFEPEILGESTLVVAALAVSDEFGDERTGIVLSHRSRHAAGRRLCSHLEESGRAAEIHCMSGTQAAEGGALAAVEEQFARDIPIRPDIWTALRHEFDADYVLLFRPESVESAQEVSRAVQFGMRRDAGKHNFTCGADFRCFTTENETKRTYTISAVLVDLQSGRFLRTGLYSNSATRTVPRNLGFAEPADAEPLLADILIELSRAMLTD